MSSSHSRIAFHSSKYEGWYSANKSALGAEIASYLSSTEKAENAYNNTNNNINTINNTNNEYILKSVIVPHAGYRFCGKTAGKAYSKIIPELYSQIVILGPSHFEYFPGCGVTSFDSLETPFGSFEVDKENRDYIVKNGKKKIFEINENVDLKEHSIEMELPFLKYIFKDKPVKVLPIIVGDNDLNDNIEIANILYSLYIQPETLFVISSDFCHWGKNFGFTFYDKSHKSISSSIESLDLEALNIIQENNTKKLDEYFRRTKNTICGRNPISILLGMNEKEKNRGKKCEVLGYSMSSKVRDFNDSSVSYAAVAGYVKL